MRAQTDHHVLVVLQMPGHLDGLKPRKRKIASEVKGSKKVCGERASVLFCAAVSDWDCDT